MDTRVRSVEAGRGQAAVDQVGLCTPHTAELSGNGWTVTWLPGRILTRSQAETAMNIAETFGTISAGADSEDDDVLWDCINAWAADLGLSGRDAVARVSGPPDERRAIPGCP